MLSKLVLKELGRQLIDMGRWIINPAHKAIVGVMLVVGITLTAVTWTIYQNLDILGKIIEIKSSCRGITNGPMLIMTFAGVFVSLFAVVAVGQIVEVVEYRKRFGTRMPENRWYTLIFSSISVIAGLIVIGIMYRYC